MKILLRFVLLFYLDAFYSVDLKLSGFFLCHILGFCTLFSFISSEIVQVHQLNHQHLVWCWLPTFQQPDRGSALETIVFHYVFALQEINFKTQSSLAVLYLILEWILQAPRRSYFFYTSFKPKLFFFFLMCFIYNFSAILLLFTWNSFSQILKRSATLNHFN